jgi:hypothetical protein
MNRAYCILEQAYPHHGGIGAEEHMVGAAEGMGAHEVGSIAPDGSVVIERTQVVGYRFGQVLIFIGGKIYPFCQIRHCSTGMMRNEFEVRELSTMPLPARRIIAIEVACGQPMTAARPYFDPCSPG